LSITTSAPFTIISSPGAGYQIVPLFPIFANNSAGTAYTLTGTYYLTYDAVSSAYWQLSASLFGSSNFMSLLSAPGNPTQLSSLEINKPLQIYNSSATAATTGTGSLTLKIWYTVLSAT